MYIVTVLLFTVLLPVASVLIQAQGSSAYPALLLLAGKWFVFWAVGIRLFIAGLRQVVQPAFTARKIFELEGDGPLAIVRELGFANLAIGLLGTLSLVHPAWTLPAAITGGIYYGLAGVNHALGQHRNLSRQVAMLTDLLVFAVLAVYVVGIVAADRWKH